MSGGYAIIRYWSIAHGCRVARISMSDERGQEHFVTVPMAKLRGNRLSKETYRDRLNGVLDRIEDAINAGNEPGEVECPRELLSLMLRPS